MLWKDDTVSADVGRNDPCPCGSGTKYKKCCLAKAKAVDTSPRERLQRVHDKLVMELLKVAKSTLGPEGIQAAWDEFWPDHTEDDFRDAPNYHLLFLPWLFYFYVPEGVDSTGAFPSEHTAAAKYLRKQRHGLDELTIEYVEAARREPLLFWQIEDVERGKGLHVKDLATGRSAFVQDVAASESVKKFDIAFGQVMLVGGIYTLNAVAPYALPPTRYRTRLLDSLRLIGEKGSGDPTSWLETDLDLLSIYHDFVEELFHPPKPMLSNTSGDPMVMTTSRYGFDPSQRAAVIERVRLLPDVEPDAEVAGTKFTWTGQATQPTMMGKITKATLTVRSAQIEVSTNSMARDRELRGVLEAELGDLLRHEDTQHETLDLERQVGEGPGPAPLDVNSLSEEGREQLRQHIQQLHMRWADEKVPLLGGLTPREAVKTPEGREKVIGLVNDWEHAMSRGPKQQIEFDFTRLRRELGLLDDEKL